jgi:DNA helicase-2/ATP-dependent DNA helicase PcrA
MPSQPVRIFGPVAIDSPAHPPSVLTETLLADLSEPQHEAVTTEAAPLCILAAAGAGKTRVLTRRVAYRVHTGSALAAHVLTLTFTRKAATELSERLARLGLRDQVAAGTFHAVAAAQLRRWWADRGQTAPTLLDRKARLLGPLVAGRAALASLPLSEIAGHIEWAQARALGPDHLEALLASGQRPTALPAAELAGLYQRYRDEKRRRGLVDFDDLLACCADAIATDPTFAAAQQWRWRHLFVDEYQDVNPLQHRLLRSWLGSGFDLCVVGDPNQAIYRWNGADCGLLHRFAEDWPGAGVVRLDENHRSSPQIVSAAASVLGPAGRSLRSSQADGAAPVVRSYPSDGAEAAAVARELRQAHSAGRPWSHLAVLVRTNAQIVVLGDTLTAAAIPWQAPGAATLIDHPAARQALAEMRQNVAAPLQMALGDLNRLAEELRRGGVGRLPDGEVAVSPADLVGLGSDEDPGAAVAALAELAAQHARIDGGATIGAFLRWLPSALGQDRGAGDRGGMATVTTFHRAKGLEWPAVWICGLERGLMPIGHASSTEALEEERRLLYVAMTRAERELRCSWAQQRCFGGRVVPREPSPWVDLILAGVDAPASLGPPGTGWRDRLPPEGRALGGIPSGRRRAARSLPAGWPEPDPSVIAALRGWRSNLAKASGVPAHVLLHDRTLEALAALRPETADQLLAVPGLGPVKAARFGSTLIGLIGDQRASA